jgi:elongation factor Ts
MWAAEMEIESKREDLQNKDEIIRQAIIKGRVEKTLKTYTLLTQPALRKPDMTVEDYIKDHVSVLGENIQVSRFCKFIVGEYEKI